jgi:hypothetical protein
LIISCQSSSGTNFNQTDPQRPRFTGTINDTVLNSAILESYNYIKNRIHGGSIIGIVSFITPSQDLADYCIDGLSRNIVDGGIFKLVDIRNLRFVEQEMKRQLSGNISEETAKRIGQQYGTDYIIVGNISQLGRTRNYRYKLTITNVETTEIQGIYYADIRSNEELARFLPENNSNNRNLPPENSTNPNQRIYYFRNITKTQYEQLFLTLSDEAAQYAKGMLTYFNANLVDGGTSDPYIEYFVKNIGNYTRMVTITIAGPYFSEVYTYSNDDKVNPGSIVYELYRNITLNRFNTEKTILNEKYGNPDISMFFR